MPPERIILEESENSSSSRKTPLSKPPTSSSDSDSKSSYNIFGGDASSSRISRVNKLEQPEVMVGTFKNDRKKDKDESSQERSSSSESSSDSKSSYSLPDNSRKSSFYRNSHKKHDKTKLDPSIISKLDPRLISPSFLKAHNPEMGVISAGNNRRSTLMNIPANPKNK